MPGLDPGIHAVTYRRAKAIADIQAGTIDTLML